MIYIVYVSAMRTIGIPLMVCLYVAVGVPLAVVIAMDWAFDSIGWLCGFDVKYWPIPRARPRDESDPINPVYFK